MTKKQISAIHLVFWVIFIIRTATRFDYDTLQFEFAFWKEESEQAVFRYYPIVFTLLSAIIFYFNYWYVIPKFIGSKKFGRIVLGVVLIYSCFIGLRYFVEEYLLNLFFGFTNYSPVLPTSFYIVDNLYFASLCIIPSITIWLIVQFVQSQKEKTEAVQLKTEAEINFLKSQVNPHFIFNTMNNIYYLVYQKSDLALSAIEKLSHLMRYVTYESQQQTVSLEAEIEYIENYIELECMRIQGEKYIKIKKEIQQPQLQIPPLLLLPFVENAFKHGEVTDPNHPFLITITQKEHTLIFESSNKVNSYQKDKQQGIGIENIKKRLALHFPAQHTLTITQTETSYFCNLTIEL
ncbi:sensor histidine kinase [Myroides odoratus]|uniref:Probable sensor-like histidine kinase YehU n=1 Tax=Myroides odoratus TaxID=256 RepID=A0A378U2Q2_MYROD|nr:sensor histidine kinase [Myroides odoratus]QQU03187.1 sensor histidine kinase [Myroides odoratus]STZ69559.1 Probable sensor-like histidine kinase YehU [Myroides odoratus]